MKIWKRILVLCLILLLSLSACADEKPDAEALFSLILNGKCEQAWQYADETMQSSFPAELANQTVASLGIVSNYEPMGNDEAEGYFRSFFHVSQSSGDYLYTLVLNDSGLISGFFITPYQASPQENTNNSELVSEEILFRKGKPDETVARLVLPKEEGSFPVVILIPGSGPCNLDATSYGISPFRDLAEGLASYGIATLRFDKYSYAHANLMAANPDFTVEEEYLLDARAAFSAMQQHPQVNEIYFLGHSQGAMLLPRIIHSVGAEQVSGGISVSGSPLHLWEIQFGQNIDHWGKLPENQQDAALEMILQEAEKANALAKMSREEVPDDTLFGIPALYQWDEMQYDALQIALENKVPMLFLQGEADFQVSPADGFEIWKTYFPDADYRLFPGITHMLTKVEEYTGTTEDYHSGDHVDEAIIDAIAQWILN